MAIRRNNFNSTPNDAGSSEQRQDVSEQRFPKSDRYIFSYNTKKKTISGYKPAYTEVEEITNIKISELTAEKDVRSGWVKFTNERNEKNLNCVAEAKWVLRFSKGNSDIDKAWKILVNLVKTDILWDIKASAKCDDHETQIICVYVTDDKNILEIVSVYDILLRHGLIELHNEQSLNNNSINFITDESTRLYGSKPTYTNQDIANLHKLFELKDTVSEEKFNKRWKEFVEELCVKKNGGVLPPDFKSTYFNPEEQEIRKQLLLKIDNFQVLKSSSKVDVLENIIKNIRFGLSSNYKFPVTDVIEHGITLLNNARPKQSIIETLFHKNPEVVLFKETITFFADLLQQENVKKVYRR